MHMKVFFFANKACTLQKEFVWGEKLEEHDGNLLENILIIHKLRNNVVKYSLYVLIFHK